MQTRLLRCECKQLDKLIRRRVVANATQIIRQLIYRPFQDVSDLTVSHLALLSNSLMLSTIVRLKSVGRWLGRRRKAFSRGGGPSSWASSTVRCIGRSRLQLSYHLPHHAMEISNL